MRVSEDSKKKKNLPPFGYKTGNYSYDNIVILIKKILEKRSHLSLLSQIRDAAARLPASKMRAQRLCGSAVLEQAVAAAVRPWQSSSSKVFQNIEVGRNRRKGEDLIKTYVLVLSLIIVVTIKNYEFTLSVKLFMFFFVRWNAAEMLTRGGACFAAGCWCISRSERNETGVENFELHARSLAPGKVNKKQGVHTTHYRKREGSGPLKNCLV